MIVITVIIIIMQSYHVFLHLENALKYGWKTEKLEFTFD